MEILLVLGIAAEAFILDVLYVCGGASILLFTVGLAILVSFLPDADRPNARWSDGWLADFLMALAVIPSGVVAFLLLVDRRWMH